MLPTMMRRALQQKRDFNIHNNPFKAKRLWPPDFSKLTEKHQFRLERRYRRRAKLKWARPRWTKAVKVTQLTSITFVLIYGVLFMDWKQENPPFQRIRGWFDKLTGNVWTRTPERFARRGEIDDTSPIAPSER